MGELHRPPLRTLHLYAGGGGGILGDLLLGHRPVCAVEINPYCRKVLAQRQADGILPWFPIWKSVKNFNGKQWNGVVDMVCGGFPCQPFSRAGKQKGTGDERNLWPDTIRIIREVGPAVAFLENVPGLLSFDYFGEIIGDLAESGFAAEWGIVSAGECGAPHLRERLWILAYDPRRIEQSPQWRFFRRTHAQSDGVRTTVGVANRCDGGTSGQGEKETEATGLPVKKDISANSDSERRDRRLGAGLYQGKEGGQAEPGSACEKTADAAGQRLRGAEQERNAPEDGRGGRRDAFQPYQMGVESIGEWWAAEPDVGRVADGVAQRVERLKALGNGQVPMVAARAFLMLAYRAGLVDRGRNE